MSDETVQESGCKRIESTASDFENDETVTSAAANRGKDFWRE
jgi:hypothetical protein